MNAITSAPELYAHAIALEREAAERYTELALRMADAGHEDLAALFGELAAMESAHLQALLDRTAGVELPAFAAHQYHWLGEAPETAARELVFRLLTPHRALLIALGAERRAQAFFERVLTTAEDPALRALAREMAAEEQEHVLLIESMLSRTADPVVHWESIYED